MAISAQVMASAFVLAARQARARKPTPDFSRLEPEGADLGKGRSCLDVGRSKLDVFSANIGCYLSCLDVGRETHILVLEGKPIFWRVQIPNQSAQLN